MRYRHLFWDFDGTLYDSYPKILDALQKTLADFSIPMGERLEALKRLKQSVYHALGHYAELGGVERETLHERFHRYHLEEGLFRPYPGLESCLRRLQGAGVKHYLYTHRDGRAWEQLSHDGLRALFADGVISTDGFPQKPAPDALLALMERNGLNPAQCAMVGDRAIDIDSGHNAGMAGILFDPDGFYPEVKTEGAAQTMDELCDWVLKQH